MTNSYFTFKFTFTPPPLTGPSPITTLSLQHPPSSFLSKFNFWEPESEFNEFEPRLKSAKNRFQLSAGLNLETLNTILSGTNSILEPRLKFKPRLKCFKFSLSILFRLCIFCKLCNQEVLKWMLAEWFL